MRSKVVLAVMSATVMGLFLAGSVFIVYDRSSTKQYMLQELNVLTRVIADRSAVALFLEDKSLAVKDLRAFSAQPAVLGVCLYAADKAIFANYTQANLSATCPERPVYTGHQFTKNELHLVVPVSLEERQIGTVFVRVGLDELNSRFIQHIKIISIIIIFISILVYFLLKPLQRLIALPIVHLAAKARVIADNKDYSVRAEKESEDEFGMMVDAFNDILDDITLREEQRDRTEQELRAHQERLERLVRNYTENLETVNKELKDFSYSVSHDLRAPLRSIKGFSQALFDEYASQLDEGGQDYLNRVRKNTLRMGELIDGLLLLSKVTRSELNVMDVNLSKLVQDVVVQVQQSDPERKVEFLVAPDIRTQGDYKLLHIVLENLVDNAWKFTAKVGLPTIEFGVLGGDSGPVVYFIKDNGVGFDMDYSNKLFSVFQRLHRRDEFEGTGVGLAVAARIIRRHGGRVWAKAEVDQGAMFFFTLSDA
ncbi:MAG: HAMP domain-containing protein [Gammaproteobacteria bacterium]|nr:HAMP domain-containing protein [Gammaproteobacteria bacterium]